MTSPRLYADTLVEDPVVMDVEFDLEDEDDINGGNANWMQNQEEEEEQIA